MDLPKSTNYKKSSLLKSELNTPPSICVLYMEGESCAATAKVIIK